MKIISKHFDALNLDEVEQLLPPGHHLQRFDNSFSEELLPEGKYFVFALRFFAGKKKCKDVYRARMVLHDVLEDCGPEDHIKVDALVFGKFCEAIEEHITGELSKTGTWLVENPGTRKVWLVLHHPSIKPYSLHYTNYHQFQIIIGRHSTPECEMWVMVEIPQHAVPEDEATASLPLSPACTELVPQSSTSTTNTVLAHPSTPSFGYARQPHKVCPSQGSPRPIPSTHPAPLAASPKQPSTSHSEEQLPSPVSRRTSRKTSKQTKHPSKTDSLRTAKKSTKGNSSAGSASCSNVSAKHPDPRRPDSSVPAKPKTPVKSGASAPRSREVLDKKFKLTPITMAEAGRSINVACVLVEVEKEGHRARNNICYDVLKVTAKEMLDPSSPRIYMKVKVFHNDGLDYNDVSLRKGQVLLLKGMCFQEYSTYLDGIVYSTRRVCVYTMNEKKLKQWHSHPTSTWYPINIENGDREADIQFDWWMEEGHKINYDSKGENSHDREAANYPSFTIAEAVCKGYFNLFCQVVKKFLYPSKSDSRCVLRVRDGSATKYWFEKFTCNPKKVKDHSGVYSEVGSLEVDILVYCQTIPPQVENLEEGSFVQLTKVQCGDLGDQHRQLVLSIFDEKGLITLLNEDDPKLQILRARIEDSAVAEEETSHGGTVESEDEMPGELQQEMERCSSPSVDTELPYDTLEEFIIEQGYKRSSKYHKQQGKPSSPKRQRLESAASFKTFDSKLPCTPSPSPSKHSQHSSSPLRQLKQKSSPTSRHNFHSPSPQPMVSNQPLQCSPIKPCSTSKKPIHATSPQLHTSKHPLKHPSSPKSLSSSIQSLHLSSPLPQQHTSLQKSSSASKHYHHPFSPQPSSSRPHSTTGWGPNSPTHTPASYTSDWKEQVQKNTVTEARQALNDTRSKLQMRFHTEVEDGIRKASLEEFYKYEHAAEEIFCVNASITDFKPVREGDCFHRGDHVCLHQWVWGMCQKCFSMFPSSRLRHIASLTLDSNHPSISYQGKLPCPNCSHECNSDGRSLGATSHQSYNTVMPFIKVKMEIEDPSTGLHLTPWLCADYANTFFNVTPTFEWLFQESEVQGLVEAILQQKPPPLNLGIKWTNETMPSIVKTVLFTTPSYSQPSPATSSHLLSSARYKDSDSPIVISPHPDPPDTMSPHSDPPTTTPHPNPPTATPHPNPLTATPPHPNIPTAASPQAPPAVSPHPQCHSPSLSHIANTEDAPVSHSPLPPPHPQDSTLFQSSHSSLPNPEPLVHPTTASNHQSPAHQAAATSPPQPEPELETASSISSELVSDNHSLAKTKSAPSTPIKHKETLYQTDSAPTSPTQTKLSNTPPQPESGPPSPTGSRKYETPTSSTTNKHLHQQPHSGPSVCIHSQKYTNSPQSPSSSTTP